MSTGSNLYEETVLIVGASSGIGNASTRAFAEEGANIAISARRKERLEELAASIDRKYDSEVLVHSSDVTEVEQVNNLIYSVIDEFGQLDHVVYSAGEGRSGSVEEMAIEEYNVMNDVLIDGAFFTTRAAIPHLRESGGSLIYLGSFAAHFPYPGNPVYGAAKWWTRGFAKSVAGEVGKDDISVTVINPSEVRTEWGEEYGTPFKKRFEPGEVLDPSDVADAIVFAAQQNAPAGVDELNLYRRDRLSEL